MAIVTRKPPRRRTYGMIGGLPAGIQRTPGGAMPSKLARRSGNAPTFKPVRYTPPRVTGFPKRSPGSPRSRPGGGAAPGEMPFEFNPNANTGTIQGAIDAGLLPFGPYLEKQGYRPPPRQPRDIGIPGYMPNLAGAVESDWELAAARGDIEAANRADEAAAAENINALAVAWGGDLGNLVNSGLISQKTAEAAKANQFSTMAELGRQLTQGQGRAQSQLAARGILSSGALPGLEAELNRQYQQESTVGLQELMGNIRGIRAQQAQGRAERQAGLANVRANIAARLSQLEAYQPIPNMQAFWDPEVQAYVDDWGRRFDRNGRRLS